MSSDSMPARRPVMPAPNRHSPRPGAYAPCSSNAATVPTSIARAASVPGRDASAPPVCLVCGGVCCKLPAHSRGLRAVCGHSARGRRAHVPLRARTTVAGTARIPAAACALAPLPVGGGRRRRVQRRVAERKRLRKNVHCVARVSAGVRVVRMLRPPVERRGSAGPEDRLCLLDLLVREVGQRRDWEGTPRYDTAAMRATRTENSDTG